MIKTLAEALLREDYPTIRNALKALLEKKDEDLLVIAIREFAASGLLLPGSKKAVVVSGIILDHEPKRSLLAKFAKKLGDNSMASYYLPWIDDILAKNIDLEPEEWAKEWRRLEDVKEIRRILKEVK